MFDNYWSILTYVHWTTSFHRSPLRATLVSGRSCNSPCSPTASMGLEFFLQRVLKCPKTLAGKRGNARERGLTCWSILSHFHCAAFKCHGTANYTFHSFSMCSVWWCPCLSVPAIERADKAQCSVSERSLSLFFSFRRETAEYCSIRPRSKVELDSCCRSLRQRPMVRVVRLCNSIWDKSKGGGGGRPCDIR